MPDDLISYELLYEVLRAEKTSTELQKLDESFFNNVINYLESKSKLLESQKEKQSIFSASEIVKTGKQIENTHKILREIYDRRENKIIQAALFSSRNNIKQNLSLMLTEERKFFQDINDILTKYRKDVLLNLLSKQLPKIEDKPKDIKTDNKQLDKTKLIRFLHSVPKFVADDLNIYGPYEQEDIANIPLNIANLLIKRKRASEIKI